MFLLASFFLPRDALLLPRWLCVENKTNKADSTYRRTLSLCLVYIRIGKCRPTWPLIQLSHRNCMASQSHRKVTVQVVISQETVHGNSCYWQRLTGSDVGRIAARLHHFRRTCASLKVTHPLRMRFSVQLRISWQLRFQLKERVARSLCCSWHFCFEQWMNSLVNRTEL